MGIRWFYTLDVHEGLLLEYCLIYRHLVEHPMPPIGLLIDLLQRLLLLLGWSLLWRSIVALTELDAFGYAVAIPLVDAPVKQLHQERRCQLSDAHWQHNALIPHFLFRLCIVLLLYLPQSLESAPVLPLEID